MSDLELDMTHTLSRAVKPRVVKGDNQVRLRWDRVGILLALILVWAGVITLFVRLF